MCEAAPGAQAVSLGSQWFPTLDAFLVSERLASGRQGPAWPQGRLPVGSQFLAHGHKLQRPCGWGTGAGLGATVVLVVFCQARPFFLACPWLARSFLAAPCPPRMGRSGAPTAGLRTAAPRRAQNVPDTPLSWPRLSSVLGLQLLLGSSHSSTGQVPFLSGRCLLSLCQEESSPRFPEAHVAPGSPRQRLRAQAPT